jgi:uncharacterized protein (DUF302 family)
MPATKPKDKAVETPPPEATAAPAPENQEVLIKLSEAVITIPAKEGLSWDEVVQSMKLRANTLNMKFVGMQPLQEEYKALGLTNIHRTEIYQFCDAQVAKKMLDFDINFLAYMPCRIGMIEGKDGKIWLVSMNLNIFTSSDTMPAELQKLALEIRDNIEQIMEAASTGEL